MHRVSVVFVGFIRYSQSICRYLLYFQGLSIIRYSQCNSGYQLYLFTVQGSHVSWKSWIFKKLFSSHGKHMENVQIDQMSWKKLEHIMENCKVTLQNIYHVCMGKCSVTNYKMHSCLSEVMNQLAMLFKEIRV